MSINVKLVSIRGDQEDFSDLIGTTGRLDLDRGKERYRPTTGDILRLARKRVTHKDNLIQVSTSFGNVFTFRTI